MIIKGKYDEAVVYTDNIEESAKEQVKMYLDQEVFKGTYVRVMPDTHSGKGCVIGFTSRLNGYIVPNLIGVDIGCGVIAFNLGKKDIDLVALDEYIRENIPHGFDVHEEAEGNLNLIFSQLHCYDELKNLDRLNKSMGTLGGGNHFIEIDIDNEGNKYLLIHTGSRNLGHQVATHYQKKAEKNILDNDIDIPKELAYLSKEDRDLYFHDFKKCIMFARLNRLKIARMITDYLGVTDQRQLIADTIHNYIDKNYIVRKGSISAEKNEKVIIPLNMRDGSLICIGKGNEEWNFSAPHGAGRLYSRRKAKEEFKLTEFEETMSNVYSTSINKDTIDESPMCYKDKDEIIKLIGDTVSIEKHIIPIYNFKAN